MQKKTTLEAVLHFNCNAATVLYLFPLLVLTIRNNYHLEFTRETSLYFIVIVCTLDVLKSVYISYKLKNTKTNTRNVLRSLALLGSTFICVYVAAVLLGAPVFTDIRQTATLSLLVTMMGVLPICLNLGAETAIGLVRDVASYDIEGLRGQHLVKLQSVLFGSWLGAVVIPLDWNRAWQEWPIPCCLGSVIGYLGGCFLCCAMHLFGPTLTRRRAGKYAL